MDKSDENQNKVKSKVDCCLLSKKRDHAWDYFSLHANQRISVFRTYIVIFALFITSSGYMIIRFPSSSMVDELIEIGLCIIFIFITCLFYLLDNRNRNLVKMAEEALLNLEKCQIEKEKEICESACKKSCVNCREGCLEICCGTDTKISSVYLFSREKEDAANTFFRHTVCFRILFVLGFFITSILILYSLVSVSYYEKPDFREGYFLIHVHDKIK